MSSIVRFPLFPVQQKSDFESIANRATQDNNRTQAANLIQCDAAQGMPRNERGDVDFIILPKEEKAGRSSRSRTYEKKIRIVCHPARPLDKTVGACAAGLSAASFSSVRGDPSLSVTRCKGHDAARLTKWACRCWA
jgi:hypothetical protein